MILYTLEMPLVNHDAVRYGAELAPRASNFHPVQSPSCAPHVSHRSNSNLLQSLQKCRDLILLVLARTVKDNLAGIEALSEEIDE
jgi:hypothetical protein